MRNLTLAIEQLGGIPACLYDDLATQPQDQAVVVNFIAGDTSSRHLGVGMNKADGIVALYLWQNLAGPSDAPFVTRYRTTCPNPDAAAQALLAVVDQLAADFIANPPAESPV